MQDPRYSREGRDFDDGPAPVPMDGYGQVDRRGSHRAENLPPSQPPDHTPRAKFRWGFVIGIVLVIIAIIGALSASSQQFRHQVALSVVRQTTPYTQLYFASPSKLPSELKVDKKNTVDFTIENDEGRVYSYAYTVTFEDSKSHAVTTNYTVKVGDGASATRQIVLTPKDRKSKYLITVSLTGMSQSIHIYAESS
jgi:hypothetical protein